MGIFSRTRDIIAANFTDLLDKAEDPAKMIRMIILEMEETLVEVRASAARTIADQKEMRRHIGKLGSLQESWTEKAELALSKGREDLAKVAFPFLSDIKRELSQACGVLHADAGVALRATFVVDPQGIIRFASVNDLSVGRNPQEVLRVLDALQTDELCPCNWTQGEETLQAA